MPAKGAQLTPIQQAALIQKVDGLLPQTQCQRCGYADCISYAQAIVQQNISINRCPTGGTEGIELLARLLKQPVPPLAEDVGEETPRVLAVIDEAWCIGCTKCINTCPVDAIFGRSKLMHVVMEDYCTGCELCIPTCPVDCITLIPYSSNTSNAVGWYTRTVEEMSIAKSRYEKHQNRLTKTTQSPASAGPEESKIATPASENRDLLLKQIMAKAKSQIKNLSD